MALEAERGGSLFLLIQAEAASRLGLIQALVGSSWWFVVSCVSPSFALACRPSPQQHFAQRRRKPELSELAVFWGESVAQACVRRAPALSPEHAASQPSNSSSKRTALPGRRLTQALGHAKNSSRVNHPYRNELFQQSVSKCAAARVR